MRNVVFFITHKTLSMEHANATFHSISKQQVRDDKKFDAFYIYNTHSDELANDDLVALYHQYDLNRFFGELKIFDYDPATPKTLAGDVLAVSNYVKGAYDPQDRYFMLKSDCVLSKNFFDEALHIEENRLVYFVAPFINAKERVTDAEIFDYCERDSLQADDTFFVEGDVDGGPTDFHMRPGVSVTDQQIKFTSCYNLGDYSAPFISVGLVDSIQTENLTWGGVRFYGLRPFFVRTDRCFVVHKYHDIVSENRATDREGPAAIWLRS